ncbi:ExbD/TolR family protein [Ferribacterium limneticum]|uniref:ExbD/TolR family protein n=1 Tax=Ferribacterium limneticum TaxID=76259 RepID=UPI001CFA294B|nr:biopolymer transporter ExbD [Ferribacterium limneticum]UCV20113.1 biopolymer transporter ExbD [Ferribacterium limneticum]
MGMHVGTADDEDEILSAINTTPLVDVMLVLLIIFLITIPVVTHTVPVELPKERSQPRITKPENINLSVAGNGKVYWNEKEIAGQEALVSELKKVAVLDPQPEVQIRGDGAAPYEYVGKVVLAGQRAGIVKLGFITEPPPRQ